MKYSEHLLCPKCDEETFVDGHIIREHGRTMYEGEVDRGCEHMNHLSDAELIDNAIEALTERSLNRERE